MTLTTFQKLLSELLAQYNEEAENHYVNDLAITPVVNQGLTSVGVPEVHHYIIEIKTVGK